MDASIRQHLHAVTIRTLHANQFNRTSSNAAHTLTDILQRYITLLALTSKQYAEHSGRDGAGVNVHDIVAAMAELGVGVDELMEFAGGEGGEMQKYSLTAGAPIEDAKIAENGIEENENAFASTSSAARRIDSLADIKSSLYEGRADESVDGVLIEYRRVPTPAPAMLGVGPSSSTTSRSPTPTPTVLDSSPPIESATGSTYKGKGRAIEPYDDEDRIRNTNLAPAQIVYPLSPVSNPAYSPPASPSRKRARHASWSPPDHIPEFLPPFPGEAQSTVTDKPIGAPNPTRRAPLPLRPTTTSKSSYTKSITYNQSSLASQWDVPAESTIIPRKSTKRTASQYSSLQPLILAYNVLQTDTQPATNPSRLRVAHHLASDSPARYTAPDTMYGATTPSNSNPLRLPAPLPTHGVSIDPSIELSTPLPQPPNKIVSDDLTAIDLSTPHLHPNLIGLAKSILPPHLYSRVTESVPPPALRPPAAPGASNNPDVPRPPPLVYHTPILAPWNATDPSVEDLRRKDLNKKGSLGCSGSGVGKKLPDANLFATWDWTTKNPDEPLVARRGRLLAYATSSSLGAGAAVAIGNSPMPNGLKTPVLEGANVDGGGDAIYGSGSNSTVLLKAPNGHGLAKRMVNGSGTLMSPLKQPPPSSGTPFSQPMNGMEGVQQPLQKSASAMDIFSSPPTNGTSNASGSAPTGSEVGATGGPVVPAMTAVS
ncbi:hypothetical protein FRB94_008496 [Tulasnella sp. JGI-2019a]|nr:hypothetical protein FRB94_008496 [Tulasnella sp. JGI-2019a]